MNARYDAIVVGAGIMGLAVAREVAAAGGKVLLLERSASGRGPEGASRRAYGNILVFGHPPGERTQLALRAREAWLELLAQTKAWKREAGLLFVATERDEAELLEELHWGHADPMLETRLLSAAEARAMVPSLPSHGVVALHSPKDLLVDPRQLMPALLRSLAADPNVDYLPRSPAVAVEGHSVHTPRGRFEGQHLYLCTGRDVAELFPSCGLTEVKLQMLVCDGVASAQRWAPVVAGGLTMCHMPAFRECSALEPLQQRLHDTHGEHLRYGIHVMGCAREDGTILLGDSHEYGDNGSFIDKEAIDRLMNSYFEDLVGLTGLRPVQRWQARYYRNGELPWLIQREGDLRTAVIGLGGTGVTYSLAIAQCVVRGERLPETP